MKAEVDKAKTLLDRLIICTWLLLFAGEVLPLCWGGTVNYFRLVGLCFSGLMLWPITSWRQPEARSTRQASRKSHSPHKLLCPHLLKTFKWFVPRKDREEIDLTIADIADDVSEMLDAGRSHGFICAVVFWHSVRTVAAYILNWGKAVLSRLTPIAEALKIFKGL